MPDISWFLASIEVWIDEDGISKKIVFSGDIGNVNKPIIKDPEYIKDADYVVMESTYGDRSHGGTPDYAAELVKVFTRTFERGGNVEIPSFAVGRTQELLYFIREIEEKKLIDKPFDAYLTVRWQLNLLTYLVKIHMNVLMKKQ